MSLRQPELHRVQGQIEIHNNTTTEKSCSPLGIVLNFQEHLTVSADSADYLGLGGIPYFYCA